MAQYVLLPSGFYHRVDDDTGPYVQSTPGVFAIVATGTGGGGGGGAVTVADGADITQGAIADPAAVAGGAGTVSAKLRRISTQLPAALGSAAAAASLPVVIASDQVLPLPTGAATAAKQPALGATVQANSTPVVLPTDPDSRPASGNITVVDSASTSTASSPVVNGQPINSITGAPTANSFLTTAINGFELARTQITGVWTGTLTFEISIDGGTTYQSAASHVSGTTIESATAVANGQFITLVAGATHFRVRATAAMTGTATVKTTYGTSGGIIKANGGLVNVQSPPSLNLSSGPSGSITAGNTAQNAAAANTNRRGFALQNLSSGDLWFSSLATAVLDQPSLKLAAGAYYETPPGAAGVGAISIIGATTGQKYSGREW